MIELKSCPFCGGNAELQQSGRNSFTIRCKGCSIAYKQKTIRFGMEWLEAKIVEYWNHRTDTELTRLQSRVEELEGALKGMLEAAMVDPSCQRAIIKICNCRPCAAIRVRAALHNSAEG